MHQARSRSPRLNHTSAPSSRSASITANVSPRRPQPRSSIVVGQPEGDEVGVGRDVGAVDLDVIARVGDHRPAARRRRRRACRARASRRRCRPASTHHVAPRPRAHSHSGVGQARRGGCPRASCSARSREISSAVSDSVDARHLQAPAVDAAQPVDPLDQRAPPRACPRASRRTRSTSWSSAWSRSVSEAALTVCSAETTRTPSGTISGGLLRGRALPHAEHPRRLAARPRPRAARSRRSAAARAPARP